jgi:hypothetical protein
MGARPVTDVPHRPAVRPQWNESLDRIDSGRQGIQALPDRDSLAGSSGPRSEEDTAAARPEIPQDRLATAHPDPRPPESHLTDQPVVFCPHGRDLLSPLGREVNEHPTGSRHSQRFGERSSPRRNEMQDVHPVDPVKRSVPEWKPSRRRPDDPQPAAHGRLSSLAQPLQHGERDVRPGDPKASDDKWSGQSPRAHSDLEEGWETLRRTTAADLCYYSLEDAGITQPRLVVVSRNRVEGVPAHTPATEPDS